MCPGARSASSHRAVTAVVSIRPASRARASRVGVSRSASGTPRGVRRPAPRLDPAQGGDERRQVRRQRPGLLDGAGDRIGAVQPVIDRPGPGEPLTGPAQFQRHGRGHGQPRPQPGQPALFVRHALDGAGMPGQPHHLVGAQPEHRVLGPGGVQPTHGQPGPPRELAGDEPAHQWGVEVDLVRMHLHRAHAPHCTGPTSPLSNDFRPGRPRSAGTGSCRCGRRSGTSPRCRSPGGRPDCAAPSRGRPPR